VLLALIAGCFRAPLTARPAFAVLYHGANADLLKEYRQLDDSINMRLNRTNAQFRAAEREGKPHQGTLEDDACAYFWRELVGKSL
jgi:hypothetical protein